MIIETDRVVKQDNGPVTPSQREGGEVRRMSAGLQPNAVKLVEFKGNIVVYKVIKLLN